MGCWLEIYCRNTCCAIPLLWGESERLRIGVGFAVLPAQEKRAGRVVRVSWHKTSSSSRGYDYAWQKTRIRIKARDSELCQPCLRKGRATQMTAIDHIISKAEGKKKGIPRSVIESDDNLECICTTCHERKTIEETGKSFEPRKATGLDGWPK